MKNEILNKIKINLLYKKKIFKIKINKKNIKIIQILAILNIIKYYKKIHNKLYYVYLNNLNSNKIINLYKPSKKIFLKYNLIRFLTFKKKWFFLVSTNKGILTNLESLKKKIGGLLIIRINK